MSKLSKFAAIKNPTGKSIQNAIANATNETIARDQANGVH